MHPSLFLLPLTASVTTALQLPKLQPFLAAFPLSLSDYLPPTNPNNTAATHTLLKRQTSPDECPADFNSCADLGAASLCCGPNSRCAPDMAGHVACCPSGAACTGTIGGVLTAGTVDSSGNLVGGGAVAAATDSADSASGLAGSGASTTQAFEDASQTASGGLVFASTTASAAESSDGSGFVLDGSQTVATPAAGVRAADVPLVAKAIIRVVEYLAV